MSVMDPCLARTFDARAEFSLGLFRFSPKGVIDSRGLRRGVGQVPFGLLSEPRNCNTSDKWHECSDCEDYTIAAKWEWDLLAHVCQSWRQIVLASSRRLNLRIGHISGLIGLSEFSPLLSNKPLSSLPAEFSEPLLLIGSPRCVQSLPFD